MASLFSHLWMFLTHVYNFKYVFNSTVIKLSWHVLCYLISKNLYSLQNTQLFIFQLICMQLCKCINYFLKAHEKQSNQYCFNFTIFLYPKKKVLKKWFRFGPSRGLGGVDRKKHGSSHRSTCFCFRLKKSGLDQVFFGLGRIRIFWPILPCQHMHQSKYIILKFVKEVAKTLVKLRITPFYLDRFSNQSSNFIYFFNNEVDRKYWIDKK